MKKTSLLILIAACAATLQAYAASYDIVERKWNEDEMIFLNVEPAPDGGYYALADYRRWVNDPASGYNHEKQVYTQAIQRLDDDFQVLWEKRFTEYDTYQYRKLLLHQGQLYVGGTAHDSKGALRCRLSVFDLDAKLQWEKTYTVPGCTETKDLHLWAIPDGSGDILATSNPWNCNIPKVASIKLRLRPNGEVVWQKAVTVPYMFYGGGGSVYLADGTLLELWFASPAKKVTDNVRSRIWVKRFDLKTGTVLWEKFHESPTQQITWRGGTVLPNGEVACAGIYETIETGYVEEWAVIGFFSQEGEFLRHKVWKPANHTELSAINLLPDGNYYASAKCNEAFVQGGNRKFAMFYRLNAAMEIIDETKIETETAGFVLPHRDGFVILNQAAILFLRSNV